MEESIADKTTLYKRKKEKNPTDIIVSAKTTCGLYDAWNGAGSIFGINLENTIKLPAKFAQPDVDGARRYGINDIYGVNDGMWE